MAVIGLANASGGWRGVCVGYDGHPEHLGSLLLDLVADRGGDLEAVWKLVASAPEGWRAAFTDPYEEGFNRDFFATGRGDAFLESGDAFVRNNIVFWYVIDLKARSLEIWENTEEVPFVNERIHFLEDGGLKFEHGPEEPLDWRNRRTVRGKDDPGETAERLLSVLEERLPIVSKSLSLCALPDHPAIYTEEGILLPVRAFLSEADASQESGIRIHSIIEHSTYRLLPRRALTETRRCELWLRTALEAIELGAAREPRLRQGTPQIFPWLFPLDLLDLELDDDALQTAIRERVEAGFEWMRM